MLANVVSVLETLSYYVNRREVWNVKESISRGWCMATLGSMTQAMRAQTVLTNAAVRAEVVKTDSARAKRGCAYAVAFSCQQRENVQRILKSAGIRVREYYEGETI